MLLIIYVIGACSFGLFSAHNIPIMGIFDPEHDQELKIAFQYAVDRINMDQIHFSSIQLEPHFEYISREESYATEKKVCSMTEKGIAAVFGPTSRRTAAIVDSICGALEIPNIGVSSEQIFGTPTRWRINLHPDQNMLAKAYADVVKDVLHWKSFSILYENNDSLERLQGVMKTVEPSDLPLTIRQLDDKGDNRLILKELREASESHLIIDCPAEKINEILHQAHELKMLSDYNNYLFTSLDSHTVDLTELQGLPVNITCLSLVNPQSDAVQNAVQDWNFAESRRGKRLNISPETVKVETALMNDAVSLFAISLLHINQSIEINPRSCQDIQPWQQGFSLRNYMKLMHPDGMTGSLYLNDDFRRQDFQLEILEYMREEFRKIGTWSSADGFIGTRSSTEMQKEIEMNIQNKTFLVASKIGKPFLDWKLPREGRVGNDRFEGYSIDLIDHIAKGLNFTYEFHLTADKQHGKLLDAKTKKWNGLVKDILDRKADLAICDLTITFERESAVDFTMPFMTVGISILYSKPPASVPSLFSFFDPLSIDVWMYMATSLLLLSLIMFMISRISPHEWEGSHPCDNDPDELENQFSLLNCLWFTSGSIMGQGCDLLPKSVAGRILAVSWWFFALIMIASYTANLAASLTVTRMGSTIEDVNDLATQNKIKYGALQGGSTSGFFEKSNFSTYQRMWTFMKNAQPDVFSNSNDEGVERVLKEKGNYAFLMESVAIEYQTNRNCGLMQVGGTLDSKGYGVAMPLDSPYRTRISGEVLKLQEKGILGELKEKWWGSPPKCDDDDIDENSMELGLKNVGGVFIVVVVSVLLAFIWSILEFLWNCRKIAVVEGLTPLEAFRVELAFAVQLFNPEKPIRKKREEDETSSFEALHIEKKSIT